MARKTVAEISRRINRKRGCALVMERAQSLVICSAPYEVHIFAYDVNNICSILDLLYGRSVNHLNLMNTLIFQEAPKSTFNVAITSCIRVAVGFDTGTSGKRKMLSANPKACIAALTPAGFPSTKSNL